MPRPAPIDSPASTLPSGFRPLYGVPTSAQPLALRHILAKSGKSCIYITHHDKQLKQFVETAPFFLDNIPVITFPAWDTLPYDRSAPARSIIAQRVAALTEILSLRKKKQPFVVATTINAFLQKLPPESIFRDASISLEKGESLDHDTLSLFLGEQGYHRTSKVMEAGEFAMRGNIVDIFPGNATTPFRLDLFGDTIESIKSFDPMTQRSTIPHQTFSIAATSELSLNEERIARFRKRYRELFGQPHRDDTLYHTVSEGHYYNGMENWLPLFYEALYSLHDYLPNADICLDHDALNTMEERNDIIHDYYQARIVANEIKTKQPKTIYNPIPPEEFFLIDDWKQYLASRKAILLKTFDGTDGDSLQLRAAKKIHAIAKTAKQSPFEYLTQDSTYQSKPVVIAAQNNGSRDRLIHQLSAFYKGKTPILNNWSDALIAKAGIYCVTTPLISGFISEHCVIYTEEDILGRRILQKRKRKTPSEAFMAEASAFETGELLVHKDHGIGRYDGLETLDIAAKRHDCLKIVYKDDDRLFLPVENLELITRHGSDTGEVELDKLGGSNWQNRKAAYKEKLRMTAEELLKTAAQRELSSSIPLASLDEVYGDFVEKFPYEETEDQEQAIHDVIADLQGSKPMDRLVCGDVGFGKTEVALRAAFIAATDATKPMQVAFIAPTTLLVRQHFQGLKKRFEDTGLNVAQLSRLCSAKEIKRVKEGIADGSIDVVVGTHALLADNIQFKQLGLLIVDEEQRFGVKQKEKLKSYKSNIHILSMSATPIPRTLQMSLTGVRDLSLITTPPVDRLAVRSFVMPFDPVVMKEAINREIHRGGQVFYVTPRIADIPELQVKIRDMVPDIRLAIAHGQMSATELDEVMNDFYDGKYDMLLSTAIIESGIDIPTANTMIIHRADRFGLAQLYQLRGRVGRGKIRAYAYFTLPYHGAMTSQAVKRLEVMQSLDTLGAGFTLASHDMDIRGFGNLVGEEQSGHVKDIGIELYQQMLADAVRNARESAGKEQISDSASDDWSPQLNLGLSILIPEEYVEDLSLRLSLYRRASTLETPEEIESFAAELADRFGAVPEETEHLFVTLQLKQTCRKAGIEKIDTGPKGAVIQFHATAIQNPQALLGFIAKHGDKMKLRADQTVFYKASWRDDADKLRDIRQLINNIASL